ncbi:MAG: ABC transporter ATP-binding protein [Geitlerinemataceae cyanobacterium]
MARVSLERIFKRYPQRGSADGNDAVSGETVVLRGIDLDVEDGEFLVLVGASGCGKSTLLRAIAGLETVTSGQIAIGNRVVNDLPPKARNIAMVFQSYALYPHLTVYDNLAFGLRRTRGWGREDTISNTVTEPGSPVVERFLVSATRSLPPALRYRSAREAAVNRRVRQVAQTLQIDTLLDRLPKQLSGGQKQRVALGRAMARNPDVFLMDEPLSNLDAKLRAETRAQIVSLQRQLGITTIYVTHDQTEAMTMGDRIAIVNNGQIVQLGKPMELYRRPVDRYVAGFIGSPPMNFLPARFVAPMMMTGLGGNWKFQLPDTWKSALSSYGNCELTLGLRPEALSLGAKAPENLSGAIASLETLGSDTYATVDLETGDSRQVTARLDAEVSLAIGDRVWLAIDPARVHLFDRETGVALS